MRHSYICHRLPERTFNIRERYFPVCSRCTGIYIGIFSCYDLIHFLSIKYNSIILLIAFTIIIPTFLDGVTQFFGFRESNNRLRFTTGLIAGFGLF